MRGEKRSRLVAAQSAARRAFPNGTCYGAVARSALVNQLSMYIHVHFWARSAHQATVRRDHALGDVGSASPPGAKADAKPVHINCLALLKCQQCTLPRWCSFNSGHDLTGVACSDVAGQALGRRWFIKKASQRLTIRLHDRQA